MPLRIKISARAAGQARKAADWRVANRPSAPGAIGKDVGESVVLLSEQPGVGAEHEGVRTLGIRRLYLGRVRCFVYCKAAATELRDLAFWHASRGHQLAL